MIWKREDSTINEFTEVDVETLRHAPMLDYVDLKDNPLPARTHDSLQDLSSVRLMIELTPRQREEWEDLSV